MAVKVVRGRESEFPPTKSVKSRESEFPPTKSERIGLTKPSHKRVPSYQRVGNRSSVPTKSR